MKHVLTFVELWEHRHKPARQLSGGMQRRLELAAALLHEPELLVVDEPTAGIDPILRAKLWDHFRKLKTGGCTILVTSQYVTEAEYCDQVAVLGGGRLVATGTPAAVRKQAMGGEIVDVGAEGLDRRAIDALKALEGVADVRSLSYDEARLTVGDASEAIPRVLVSLAASGADVTRVEEYHPNFDEVFVRLMEQAGVDRLE